MNEVQYYTFQHDRYIPRRPLLTFLLFCLCNLSIVRRTGRTGEFLTVTFKKKNPQEGLRDGAVGSVSAVKSRGPEFRYPG